MPKIKKIGVITSGGDCGGLNAVIKGAAGMADSMGIKCFVIPNGYAGLYNLVDFDQLAELTRERTDRINASKVSGVQFLQVVFRTSESLCHDSSECGLACSTWTGEQNCVWHLLAFHQGTKGLDGLSVAEEIR